MAYHRICKEGGLIRHHETQVLGWYAIQRVNLADLSDDGQEDKQDEKQDNEKSDKSKLEDAVKESHGILARATTVFPFTPFPDTVVIDRHKLTIVRRHLGTQQALSVPIENIKNVQADMGPIFGTLTIISDQFVNSEQKLEYLRRGDVEKIQKMVQGIVMATKEDIDVSEVDPDQLKALLTELGEGHTRDI